MRAVTMSWRDGIVGLVDKEMVGEEVASDTVKCALLATGFGPLEDG